jgi:hypothetical protein
MSRVYASGVIGRPAGMIRIRRMFSIWDLNPLPYIYSGWQKTKNYWSGQPTTPDAGAIPNAKNPDGSNANSAQANSSTEGSDGSAFNNSQNGNNQGSTFSTNDGSGGGENFAQANLNLAPVIIDVKKPDPTDVEDEDDETLEGKKGLSTNRMILKMVIRFREHIFRVLKTALNAMLQDYYEYLILGVIFIVL